MSRITVKQYIDIFEIDGKECPLGGESKLGVNSHWNDEELVVLALEGKMVTVSGTDLIQATQNAMNSG